jgi:hypothetical protein
MYYPPTYGGGGNFYAGGSGNAWIGANFLARPFGNLLDYQGNPVNNVIRNNFVANALSPSFPAFGSYVRTANDFNLIQNSGRFIDNVVGGYGYNRDPFGSFVRNDFYADQLGRFNTGLGTSLSNFNRLNLYASILG